MGARPWIGKAEHGAFNLATRTEDLVLAHDRRRRTNDQAIVDLARLGRLLPSDRILDTTYGLGRFWRKWCPANLVAGDRDPARARNICLDATALPFAADTFDVVVFDPPYKLVGTSRMAMDAGYGVGQAGYAKGSVVAELIRSGTAEAIRVSRRLVLVKCMDQIAARRQHWQTVDVHVEARRLGAVVVEELHVSASIPQRLGRQYHARGRPSTFLAIEVSPTDPTNQPRRQPCPASTTTPTSRRPLRAASTPSSSTSGTRSPGRSTS